MQVKELIAELQKIDPELGVIIADDDATYDVSQVIVNPWNADPHSVLLC